MKAILSNGQEVRVNWQYTMCQKEVGYGKRLKVVDQDCTICNIFTSDKNILSSATVHRYHKDIPNKTLARKTTFKIAVSNFSKEDKRLLWHEFLKNIKIK